jgi:hypothetical protein
MKTTVSKYDFIRAFEDSNRSNSFSSDGLEILYDYLSSYEEDIGEEVELDVIAFCCEFSEYDLEEINNTYEKEFKDMDEASNWLNYRTMVCGHNDDIIVIQDF